MELSISTILCISLVHFVTADEVDETRCRPGAYYDELTNLCTGCLTICHIRSKDPCRKNCLDEFCKMMCRIEPNGRDCQNYCEGYTQNTTTPCSSDALATHQHNILTTAVVCLLVALIVTVFLFGFAIGRCSQQYCTHRNRSRGGSRSSEQARERTDSESQVGLLDKTSAAPSSDDSTTLASLTVQEINQAMSSISSTGVDPSSAQTINGTRSSCSMQNETVTTSCPSSENNDVTTYDVHRDVMATIRHVMPASDQTMLSTPVMETSGARGLRHFSHHRNYVDRCPGYSDMKQTSGDVHVTQLKRYDT